MANLELSIYQIDAFANEIFEGNPAAVCPLDFWLPDVTLQNIAQENNLSETAFFVAGENSIELRWFTPKDEVDLCGHATLATAHVLFKHIGHPSQHIQFQTKSGLLSVEQTDSGYRLDFPAAKLKPVAAPDTLINGLGVSTAEVFCGYDYIVLVENEDQVRSITPDFLALSQLDLRGIVVTSPGDTTDFVSRCFFPKLGVNEDPITGSAHCELAPFWSEKLGKNKLVAKQLSQRSGTIICEVVDDRVFLEGSAVDYMIGKITIKT